MFFVAEKIKRIWLELINNIYGDLFFIKSVFHGKKTYMYKNLDFSVTSRLLSCITTNKYIFLVAVADNKIYSGLVWFEHISLYIYSIQKVRTQVLITYVV